ncbi:MAG: sugar phosphate isomerase/epimerase [Acidobacteriota bacterium]|nr:sugar phosphate isomerase/epimerase [Acidobacteriota bacterium]
METGQPPDLRAGAGAALTRRTFVVTAAAGIFAACSKAPGVTFGVQSYSFRDRPLDDAIAGMQKVGLKSCELWQSHIEPRNIPRDKMRRWRETIELDMFHRVREKFARASIALSAYNISFKDDYSDIEIERGFEMAKALGAPVITSSSNVKTVTRIAPVAARQKMLVGMHNHSQIDPNEFASAQSLTEALRQGPFIAINLDIGHFTAANEDAVAFLRQHHDRIVTLHLKDRKRDQGPNVPFGEGDTPIIPVLKLLQANDWGIPANIEYEYEGGDSVEEVGKCLDYCRRALEA